MESSLAVVHTTLPVHYYSLFSQTIGCDAVLACYSGRRYELELKYTTFVDIHSRPVLPRLDLSPLAAALSEAEAVADVQAQPGTATEWSAWPVQDSGPLMRVLRRQALQQRWKIWKLVARVERQLDIVQFLLTRRALTTWKMRQQAARLQRPKAVVS